MNLPKIHSISKKICVALLGGFLLIFLLFHASANLLVLRHDDGAWYSAFCHFMGTNYIVKVFEIVLLGFIALHICFTAWLWITNRLARPVRYHMDGKSKTHPGSKLMMWTGILIFSFFVMHFCQFYFVKLGWVKGEYMVKTEKLQDPEMMQWAELANQMDQSLDEFINDLEARALTYTDENSDAEETQAYIDRLRGKSEVLNIITRAYDEDNISEDGKWIRHLTYEERKVLRDVLPESDPEPDFYYMVRQLFHNPIMVILYLITFVVLFIHMRHAFPSAFQTLGLNNYKYAKAIDILGQIYAWVVCLMFAAVVVLVYLGL